MHGYTRVQLKDHELPFVFPEAKSRVKELLKEVKKKRTELWEQKEEIERAVIRYSFREQDFIRETLLCLAGWKKENQINESKIKKYERFLWLLNPGKENFDLSRAIALVKELPITNLIEFKKGVASCVWHKEKTPSMKYYQKKNKVHCFGCGRGGDIIDVLMAQTGLSFVDAVKKLYG